MPGLATRSPGSLGRNQSMDRLWAPWRAQYIKESSAKAPSSDDVCFLCRGLAAEPTLDRDNLLAWRGPHSAIFLNRYPYNNGHLLVAPLVHQGTLEELEGSDLTEPIETVRRAVAILDRIFRPQGYNIGLNLGKSAGAGLPGHLHWHIVPRWDGDTNFMPVLGQTKVIVESLSDFYDRLVAELALEG
jgi:ATP adenylyltransferase